MTFQNILSQTFDRQDVRLFEFRRGNTIVRFAAARSMRRNQPFTFGGLIWLGEAITHSAITHSADFRRTEFTVTLPASNTFATAFPGPATLERTEVSIFRTHANDPDGEVIAFAHGVFTQAIPRSEQNNGGRTHIDLVFQNPLALRRGSGIGRTINPLCDHEHYGPAGCMLNIADFQIDGTVSAINGRVLTINEAFPLTPGDLIQGRLDFGPIREVIKNHEGAQVTLQNVPRALIDEFEANGTAAVKIAPGCNLSTARCENRFNNLPRHGGFPRVDESVFDGRSFV